MQDDGDGTPCELIKVRHPRKVPLKGTSKSDPEEQKRKHCATCRIWRQRNPEKVREQKARYRATQRAKATRDKWRMENAERTRAQAKAWRDKNLEKVNSARRSHYASFPEIHRARFRKHYYADHEKTLERQRRDYREHRERYRERDRKKAERRQSITTFNRSPEQVFKNISAIVPAGLSRHDRDDLIGALCLAVLEGKLLVGNIKPEVARYLAAHNREYDHFKTLSLDETLPGGKGSWVDTLTEDDKPW
jgi:hypothetical protein